MNTRKSETSETEESSNEKYSKTRFTTSQSSKTSNQKVVRPSKRWLMNEIDKLYKQNLEFSTILKDKDDLLKKLQNDNKILSENLSLLTKKCEDKSEIQNCQKINKELTNDNMILKNLTVRLNNELENYQSKLVNRDDDSGLENVPKPRLRTSYKELTALYPLLDAYDQALIDKKLLINDYKTEMNNLTAKFKEILEENNNLQDKLNHSNESGELTRSKWLDLNKNLEFFINENEILKRQMKMQLNKFQDLRLGFQSRISELSEERDELLNNYHQTKTELSMLKGRFLVLNDEYNKLKDDNINKISMDVHKNSVQQCKRLLDELKSKYTEENQFLTKKITNLENSKPEFEVQLANLATERDVLTGRLNELEKNSRELKRKLAETEERLTEAESVKERLSDDLRVSVKFSTEILQETELLRNHLKRYKNDTEINKKVSQLSLQLKAVQQLTTVDMTTFEKVLEQQLRGIATLKNQHAANLDQLQTVIDEKEMIIKQLQHHLNSVWKVSTD